MKRTISFLGLLAVLSAISGYLMSKASWIGRVGMTFFYKEYNLLKIWWQGAIAIFIVVLLLFAVHTLIQARLRYVTAKAMHFLLLLIAVAGLYFTYDDFTHEFTHKMLGHRFHFGFYLFWVDWILICIFFLLKKKTLPDLPTNQGNKETIA